MELDEYLRELGRVKLLEPEEERELWRRCKEDADEEARKRLIEAYQPLVFRSAAPYRSMRSIMDILQEGTVGLIEAVEKYDPLYGTAFSLYAIHRIRGRMRDFLRREGRTELSCIEDGTGEGVQWDGALTDMGPSVQEQAEVHELILQLRQAMDRLPMKERTVLEGVYLRSEEVRDVAEELHLSISHIYRLQKSGIRRVRGMLAKFMHQWKI